MREENLGKLLPHLRPVDEEARGKGAKSFGVRANYGPSQKDGVCTYGQSREINYDCAKPFAH